MKKYCRVCSERLYGRTDQRFCSDYCRNRFHNQKRKQELAYLRRIDRILRRNRAILKQLWEAGSWETDWDHLLRLGFRPSYCTGSFWKGNNRQTLLFYEMGIHLCAKNKPPGKGEIFRVESGDYPEVGLKEQVLAD